MSSDHYAQHLIQKYRLAVAIGIIQTKPEAKSLDQYITDLRNKINDEKMEDLTICSDDFEMEFNDMADLDDRIDTTQCSDTILKNFNDEFGHICRENSLANVITGDNEESQVPIPMEQNDFQSTFCETQVQPDAYIASENTTDIDNTFCDSTALINRNKIVNNITKEDKTQTTIDETTCKNIQTNQTINIDKAYCDILVKLDQNKTANTENSLCDNITNIREQHAKDMTKIDIDKQYLDQTTAFDSQATELYTLHTLTEDYTHVSQSQSNNIDISNKYIKGICKRNDYQDMCLEDRLPMHVINTEFDTNIKDVNLVKKINKNLGKVSNSEHQIDDFIKNTQITTSISRFDNENDNLQENTEFSYNFKDINLVKKINKTLHKKDIAMAAVTENVKHNTQTSVDVNNSIYIKDNKENKYNLEENEINTEFEYSFKNINLARKVRSNLEKDTFVNIAIELDVDKTQVDPKDFCRNHDNTQEIQVPAEENPVQILSNNCETNTSHNTATVHEISNICNDDMTMQVFNFSQNNQDLFLSNENNNVKDISKTNVQNPENMTMQVFNLSPNVKLVESNKIPNSAHEISNVTIQNTETTTLQASDFSQNIQNPDHRKPENDIENESVSSEEVSELVPFKVMEELNRVKAYLNRRIERRMSIDSSLDSGYRSDSQGRSKNALQLSGNWIAQSAYCLYEHISRCPMVATTQEIVEEISQVLGQLIDRLHEEELYPPFLEELLDHMDTLIRSIFTEEDMLLEKDEKIQRLFLFNKSNHIQKYSIEKLTDILENTHTNLTAKEDLYELTNIQEVENLSYMFYILEVLIKRHLKTKKYEDTQTQSQETENYSNRKSISDIWRKKWNPNYKEELKLDSSLDKKCVFTKCSEVLNKIVVGCLDGYSLVAYAALQCFNLLQS